jgi:hypothetical protein
MPIAPGNPLRPTGSRSRRRIENVAPLDGPDHVLIGAKVERLDEVAIGAEIVAVGDVLAGARRTPHDHRNLAQVLVCLDLAQDFAAVEPRQVEIEQNEPRTCSARVLRSCARTGMFRQVC